MNLISKLEKGEVERRHIAINVDIQNGELKLANYPIHLTPEFFQTQIDGSTLVYFSSDSNGIELLNYRKIITGGNSFFKGKVFTIIDKAKQTRFHGWEVVVPEVIHQKSVSLWMWNFKQETKIEDSEIQKEIEALIESL